MTAVYLYETGEYFDSIVELATRLGVSRTNIHDALSYSNRTVNGMHVLYYVNGDEPVNPNDRVTRYFGPRPNTNTILMFIVDYKDIYKDGTSETKKQFMDKYNIKSKNQLRAMKKIARVYNMYDRNSWIARAHDEHHHSFGAIAHYLGMCPQGVINAYKSADYWKNEWLFANGEIKEWS